MLARLMDAKSASPTKPDVTLLARFMTLLGRLFQIRDDYMNLTSADVSVSGLRVPKFWRDS
jgi:fusicocca-2,10(14)-diene synthase/ophiobolin F synthase